MARIQLELQCCGLPGTCWPVYQWWCSNKCASDGMSVDWIVKYGLWTSDRQQMGGKCLSSSYSETYRWQSQNQPHYLSQRYPLPEYWPQHNQGSHPCKKSDPRMPRYPTPVKWTTMIAMFCIDVKIAMKQIHMFQHWLSCRLLFPLIELLCFHKWIQQMRQLCKVMITIAPIVQYNSGDVGSRLEEMLVLFAILEVRPSIPFFPPFMFAPSRDENL